MRRRAVVTIQLVRPPIIADRGDHADQHDPLAVIGIMLAYDEGPRPGARPWLHAKRHLPGHPRLSSAALLAGLAWARASMIMGSRSAILLTRRFTDWPRSVTSPTAAGSTTGTISAGSSISCCATGGRSPQARPAAERRPDGQLAAIRQAFRAFTPSRATGEAVTEAAVGLHPDPERRRDCGAGKAPSGRRIQPESGRRASAGKPAPAEVWSPLPGTEEQWHGARRFPGQAGRGPVRRHFALAVIIQPGLACWPGRLAGRQPICLFGGVFVR